MYSLSHYGSSAPPSPLDPPAAQLDRLDQAITNQIKDLRNHVGQARDGLLLHVKAKHAASACLVTARCDAIEAMIDRHHKETRIKLGKLSDDIAAIRSETTDFAAGLESVTEFAGKMNDNFTTGFESIESKVTTMDKKLDTVGRAVNTMDRRLITAKDDINEVNFRVGEIKENNAALRADHKSLLEKHDVLIEQRETEAERRASITDDMKSFRKEFKVLHDNQTTLITKMKEFQEWVARLQTENERLRLENQKLRENSNSTPNVAQPDLQSTMLCLLQKFDASESRIDQIFNML